MNIFGVCYFLYLGLMYYKRLWCWEWLGAGEEGDDRGWDGWMASLTQCTWVWVNSGSWWWTGRPGVLRFMGSQRVGHDWVTELNWTERKWQPRILAWRIPWTEEPGRLQSMGSQRIGYSWSDARAEAPILWPPHAKSWLIGKDSDAGRDWGQEKGTTEDEMAGWHHWLDGRESEWTPGDGDGQGGLACCASWRRRVRQDWATELNWTEVVTKSLLEIQGDCWKY